MIYNFARYLSVVLAVGGAAMCPTWLNAQEPSDLSRLYGRGVNAYFAGRSSEAEAYLSQALTIDGEDPRLYYFRALSLLRMGRLEEARGDMTVGANIEAQRPQRFAVGRALERVQGSNRLMLEQYRRRARSLAAAVSAQSTPATDTTQLQLPPRRQPQQASFNDQAALRQRIVIPLDRLLGAGTPQPLSADELAQRARPAIRSLDVPPRPSSEAAPSTAESEDPFRDDPSRTDVPEAAEALSPAAESNGEEQFEMEEEQPEAGEMSDSEAAPESEETPEAEATPEAEDNPFDF